MERHVDEVMATRIRERQKLYEQGLGDRAIARAQQVDRSAVRDWRRRNGLPANVQPIALSAKQEATRRAMYDQGVGDTEIGRVVGAHRLAIRRWRQRHGLPDLPLVGGHDRLDPSKPRSTPDAKRRVLALLRLGVSARMIERETDLSRSSIDRWRQGVIDQPGVWARPDRRPRAMGGRSTSKMTAAHRRRAFLLYADGLNDVRIATDLGVSVRTVLRWRTALTLVAVPRLRRPAAVKRAAPAPAITPMSNPLFAAISGAIGRIIAPDLIDDAVSEMWLAIAEGRLSVDDVAAQAGRFRNRVIADYASRFGPRSLDEDIGADGDGFRMIDMIRDESSSSWLEEMGATAW